MVLVHSLADIAGIASLLLLLLLLTLVSVDVVIDVLACESETGDKTNFYWLPLYFTHPTLHTTIQCFTAELLYMSGVITPPGCHLVVNEWHTSSHFNLLLRCNFLLHEALTGKIRNVSVSAQPTTKGCLLKYTLSNSVEIYMYNCVQVH